MMRRAALVAALVASTAAAATDQVFRVGADTVLLSVTVSDSKHQPITGLLQNEFQILEDGVPQSASVFASDPQPIALSLLIDSSMSMESKLSIAQAAAIGFVRRLRAEDVAQVITFDNQVHIRQTFTNDVARLEDAVRGIQVTGSTALYTAVYIAMTELKRLQPRVGDTLRRQAIVVLSDGEDNQGPLQADEVIDAAKRNNVMVYAVALRNKERMSGDREPQAADYALRSLSQVTGGRLFGVTDLAELPSIYNQIADELANQYILGYTSRNTARDGTWRHVSVRVARPNSAVRTKSGYFAPR